MLVLGIETSTPHISVAIGSQTELVASYEVGRGKSQDQVLMPAAERLLSDASLDWSQLGGIAVGLGPGMFTGLRVGVATAKALAQALNISIVGHSSLDALAYKVRYARRTICTCVDARRNEVYWAFYRPAPGGLQRETQFRCAPAEHCANEIQSRGEPVLVVGNGPYIYPEPFDVPHLEIAGPSDATPTAARLVELAVTRLMREDADRLTDVRPLYIRKSDAEMNWERLSEAQTQRGGFGGRSAPEETSRG